MSGAPNVEQIRELRSTLEKVSVERETIRQAQALVEQQREVIRDANEQLVKNERRVSELLAAMDCEPNGNYGSLNRTLSLLTGLVSEWSKP